MAKALEEPEEGLEEKLPPGSSMLPPGSWAPSRPGDFDAPSNVRPEDRPATAPDDVYRQTSSATGSTRKSSDSDERPNLAQKDK